MTQNEMVTQFKLEDESKQSITQKALMRGLTEHVRKLALWNPMLEARVDFEGFCSTAEWTIDAEARLPEKFRWLIAFWVEGESEGWYVHVGSLNQGTYLDFGFTKVFDAESAKLIAVEAQRFLNAARWN